MLCTVSTVKDSAAGVERFVERNLAAGADHMFVLLEGPDEAPYHALRDHPHVTAARARARYWHDRAPHVLNDRQRVNADLVNTVLAFVPTVRWLFHLDGDEVLDLDRARLAEAAPGVRSVNLTPLEAVSQERWDGEVDRFKRQLDPVDLSLLVALGALSSADNTTYFRGHLQGKPGLRPSLELRPGVHTVEDRSGAAVEPLRAPYLRMLHYEAYSGAEFVRKWGAHLSGGGGRFRRPKQLVRSAVRSVQRNEHLTQEQREHYLLEIYRRLVAEPVELLDSLGFLVTPDPAWHRHTPQPFPAEDREAVAALWQRLVEAPKGAFLDGGRPGAVRGLVAEVRSGLGPRERALARRMDRVLGG